MSITLVPCNTRCLNMGDVAMLQVAVSRLRALWPDERICVFTTDAAALRRYCPEVEPVFLPDQPGWTTDRYFGGRLHAWIPDALSERAVRLHARLAYGAPRLHERLLRLRTRLDRADRASLSSFLDTITSSRLVATAGAGGLADHFRDYTNLTLLALQTAHARGIPTAMLGHGFGPLTLPDLRAKAAIVLPDVDLIAVRERRSSLALLLSLGVRPDRVMTTGDDAIELAYDARAREMGEGIGVNLRIARSSAVTGADIASVRAGVWRFLETHPAPLLPLPIARQQDLDMKVIREIVRPEPGESRGRVSPRDAGVTTTATTSAATSVKARAAMAGRAAAAAAVVEPRADDVAVEGMHGQAGRTARGEPAWDDAALDTPLGVIQQTGRCRIIVTGAYHAAVFALAQGIPAVCLARSRYFTDKFAGLADLFRAGCFLIALDDPDLPGRLADAMTQAWHDAPIVRGALLDAAAWQIVCGQAAYQRLHRLVDGDPGGPAPPD